MIATQNNRYIDLFLEYIFVEKGASRNTVLAYKADLNLFQEFLNGTQIPLLDITEADVYAFLEYLLNKRQLAASSKARIISALKQLYLYLCNEEYIKQTPLQNVKLQKKEKIIPKTLSEEEVTELFKVAYEQGNLRNIVALELLYATGMRISELITLSTSSIIWDEGCVLVRGKGDKERLVPLTSSAIDTLRRYLGTVHKRLYIFPSGKTIGKHMSRQRFFQIIKELAVFANIDPNRISPHVIRHAFATHLLNNGANLVSIQKLLGHADISTTEIYTHVMTDKLKQTLEKHPLSRKSKT